MRRIGVPLAAHELERVRAAARRRGLPVPEFLRQSAIAWSDDTLAQSRFAVDPYARREVESYAITRAPLR